MGFAVPTPAALECKPVIYSFRAEPLEQNGLLSIGDLRRSLIESNFRIQF